MVAAQVVGVLGGTGPHGRGLAVRLRDAGYEVLLGSRDAGRARDAADGLPAGAAGAAVHGVANADAAARSDVVIVTVPYDGQEALVPPLAGALAGKVVVSCANPMAFDAHGPRPVHVPEGSAAEQLARLAPEARVVSGFQNVSARKLADTSAPVRGDVLLCGDDVDAVARCAELVDAIPHLRAFHAGPLRLSGIVEHLTVVLLSVNRRYRAQSTISLEGVADPRAADA